MATINQPQFWLQVRKDYIFDNFDNLLNYLRQYTYILGENHPDYNPTLQCMTSLSEDIGNIIRQTPFYSRPEIEYDTTSVIRLFCATILASNKAGITPHNVILSLIDLVMKSPEIKIDENELIKIFHIALNCIRGRELVRCGFTWDNISDPNLAPSMLMINFSRMSFRDVPADQSSAFIESKGLLVVPPRGDAALSVVNRHKYDTERLETQFSLPEMLDVKVPCNEYEKAADFEKLYKITTRLLAEMDQTGPSPRTVLKNYDEDESFLVKVISKRGIRVEAETIDPEYHQIRGKVLLELPQKRPATQILCDKLRAGDFLRVHLSAEGDFKFEVIDAFEDFYRELVCDSAAQEFPAIFSTEYANGTEWITNDGMRIGIDKIKRQQFDEATREIFEGAIETGAPIYIKLYNQPPHKDKETFFAYGDVTGAPDINDENNWFTQDDADNELVSIFMGECADQAAEIVNHKKRGKYTDAARSMCVPLISLIARQIKAGLSSCRTRLEYITAAAMVCKILGRPSELAYMEHERKFLFSQVLFAQNRDFGPLTHPAALEGAGDVERHEKIVNTLRRYRKKEVTHSHSDSDRGEEDVIDKVDALVTASNNLIDIIDNLELNNIKQAIARALSIEDEYVSILDDRTFYGMESISLEFKTSVVFPPANRRRLASAVADPELQKWAIVKAVCGFLNSRSGGELLLGVNDAGYAVGVEEDIKKLYELRQITVPEIDKYCNYLNFLLDRAFKEPNPKVLSTDIARTCITYQPEENAEGKTIIRIQIRPYHKNLVSLASAERPQGIEDSYVRLSGRTVPVTPVMKAEIMKYKM